MQTKVLLTVMSLVGGFLHAQAACDDVSTFDAEVLVLPRCAVIIQDEQMYLTPAFLKVVFPRRDRHLIAYAVEGEKGFVYFNSHGRAVIRNVATCDNGADYFHHGIVRVVRDGKWGLANKRGEFVVPFQFDGILPPLYNERRWAACMGCRDATDNGEHHWFEGGTWFWIDTKGHVTEGR